MTHEENSLRTKTMLCNTLKELMKHKSFSKITVSELIKECNLNRKTFYYHFQDIYDLLKWMLEQETFEVVKQFDLSSNYREAFDFIMDYVENNAYLLNCIYDSVGRDELKRFLYKDFIEIMEKIVKDCEVKLNITVSDSFRNFTCNFYTEAIAGMIINLFQNPDAYNRSELFEHFSVILYNSLPSVILSQKEV